MRTADLERVLAADAAPERPVGPGLALALLAGGAVALAAMLARRLIGGYTGDVLGFFQQIGEIVMLLVAAAR